MHVHQHYGQHCGFSLLVRVNSIGEAQLASASVVLMINSTFII